jgi:hypothetical protein
VYAAIPLVYGQLDLGFDDRCNRRSFALPDGVPPSKQAEVAEKPPSFGRRLFVLLFPFLDAYDIRLRKADA